VTRFFTEADCQRSFIDGKTVSVVGYGNQGRAHALNLRDSGVRVVVGLRPGSPSVERAASEGLETAPIPDAVSRADVISLLIPDEVHGSVYEGHVASSMKPRAALCLAHGLSVRYGILKPERGVDVFMVAPLGAGSLLRQLYKQNAGLPSYVAVHQDSSGSALQIALAYAWGIGSARAGLLETTFKDEAEVDLFGEQAVLCGGVSFLLLNAFNVLVQNGYPPEMAYMECVSQLTASADVISREGLDGFAERVSTPALYGLVTRGKRVVGEEVERRMQRVLRDIQSGEFVKEWLREGTAEKAKQTDSRFSRLLAAWNALGIHAVGRRLRGRTGGAPREGGPDGRAKNSG
jgi:ketol-acid reductoisomerase